MNTNASEEFFSSTSAPAVPMEAVGDVVKGTIVRDPVKTQQRHFKPGGGGDLKFWKDGQPAIQLVVALQTDLRDNEVEDDLGIRNLYVKKPSNLYDAVSKAMFEAKAKKLEVGGTLTITRVADIPPTAKGMNPAKDYVVKYEGPGGNGVGLGTEAPANNDGGLVRPEGVDDATWQAIVALQNK